MDPLISILIPAYNSERWLAHTIKSALAQTWARKEIIIVDDGSRDGTLALARSFESPSVKVVTQPNQGAAAARNTAFSHSQGDYIQWLDADDLLASDKIGLQVAALQKGLGKTTLLSSGWGRFIFRQHRAPFNPSALWADLAPVEWMTRKMEQDLYMQTATWLVSRELTQAAGPWDTRLLGDDDGEYFCRVLMASDGSQFVPEARTYYRAAGADSLSYVGSSTRKLDAQFLACKLCIEHLRAVADTPRVRAACLQYLQRYQKYFHPETPELVRQSRELARELGGELELPRLSWKYAWIEPIFGAAAAKRLQVSYNRWKSSLEARWDKALFRFDHANGC